MPPKKRAPPVKAAKAPARTQTVPPKEKPATMAQEAWDEEKRRCAFATADHRRRRLAAEEFKAEAAKAAAAAEVCLSLGGGGPSEAGSASYHLTGRSLGGAFSRSASPSSPGYFVEASSLSQMRLSQMDECARYSPEYADNDMTVDPDATYSPDSAPRGSGAFRFPIDLNESPDLRRVPASTAGHVTDGTGLPRSLFSGVNRSAHQVFGSTSGVSMGDDDMNGAEILSGFVRRNRGFEPEIDGDDYEEEAYDR